MLLTVAQVNDSLDGHDRRCRRCSGVGWDGGILMVRCMAGILVGLKGEAVQGMPLTIAQVADNGRRRETIRRGRTWTDVR